MSREIKFRGQCITGKWYYGNLAIAKKDIDHVKAGSYISNSVGCPFAYHIRPETVGEFTGLKDKNGVEIYEGDKWQRDIYIGIVEFRFGGWCFTEHDDSGCTSYPSFYTNCGDGVVIGNIHETPELLTEGVTEG